MSTWITNLRSVIRIAQEGGLKLILRVLLGISKASTIEGAVLD